MGSGPKTTTTSTNTGNSTQQGQSTQQSQQQGQSNQGQTGQTTSSTQATSTSTPNLPDWFMPFKQAIAGQYGNLYSALGQQASKPLYGNSQIADYQEQLNRGLGQNRQDLSSVLASQGALNSGRAAQTQTALSLGGTQQMQDYLAKLPLLNAQNQQNLQGQQLSALNGAGGLTVPYGQTTSSNQQSIQDMVNNIINSFSNSGSQNGTTSEQGTTSSNGTQTQQQSGGFLQSLLGGLLNAGLGFASGGLSNILGGGSFMNPSSGIPGGYVSSGIQH